jgi:nifR3 family TIM-barrel protein
MKNFWRQLEKPIFALSPMDGVTDAAYRFIAAKHGRADVHFTEFVNVEGLTRNAHVMLDDFLYSEIERPIVAQIYGSEPESFYKIAVLACELGFDGIDVNMGCPAKNVAARGCGAALIRNPPLAKEIIRSVKQGVRDWAEGKSAEDLGLKPRMAMKVRRMNRERVGIESAAEREAIPVSVKTRIGYDSVVIEDWVQHLLEEEPVTISIHGRTLKQMYNGSADWEAIARAAEIIRRTPTLVLGNGDLKSMADAVEKIRMSGVDGVLLGRGAIGNPWIFREKDRAKALGRGEGGATLLDSHVETRERFDVLLEHSRYFEQLKGVERFSAMRKHFGWYVKGIPHAAELRGRMFQASSSVEIEKILGEYFRCEFF